MQIQINIDDQNTNGLTFEEIKDVLVQALEDNGLGIDPDEITEADLPEPGDVTAPTQPPAPDLPPPGLGGAPKQATQLPA